MTPDRHAPAPPASETDAAPPSRGRRWAQRALKAAIGTLIVWLLLAYLILPALWRHYEHQPALADAPKTTLTSDGIPGDPLNIGLVGREEDVVKAMLGAGWSPADPITLASSLRIAASVVLRRPDPDAPVSDLFLFGRRQDLAFEKPVGGDARRRHHVRFWRSADLGVQGVPLFLGSATFDRSVGLSHDTGQITHHIAPEIDAQRDLIVADLVAEHKVEKIYQVTGVGATVLGYNGEGDRYTTDGELSIAMLAPEGQTVSGPDRLPNPTTVRIKQQLWTALRPFLGPSSP